MLRLRTNVHYYYYNYYYYGFSLEIQMDLFMSMKGCLTYIYSRNNQINETSENTHGRVKMFQRVTMEVCVMFEQILCSSRYVDNARFILFARPTVEV